MFDQSLTCRIDEAIDRFEEAWTSGSPPAVKSFLGSHDLAGHLDALAELLRIDIELRYRHGHPVNFRAYLDEFPELKQSPVHVRTLAFEDYRTRKNERLPLDANRYQLLPGIRGEGWFQELVRETDGALSIDADPLFLRRSRAGVENGIGIQADPAFEAALAEKGFQLVEVIGQGSLGTVYLAIQHDLANRYVVLKVVAEPMSEPQRMALLQHTNIVPIYSFATVRSRSVICMPYAGRLTLADFLANHNGAADRSGESLVSTVHARIQSTTVKWSSDHESVTQEIAASVMAPPAADDRAVSKPLQELKQLDCNRLATWIFKRLASALAHAHARGVLHNDLKPGNVLIRNDGEPALLDFNLSRAIDGTDIDRVGGTVPYMSPEALRGLMGQQQSPRESSDVYSMGVMLFQFVTGRLPFAPFPTIAPIDLEADLQSRKSDAPWSSDDHTSAGLRSIIDRCLAYRPDDRYQDADELHSDLQREHDGLALAYAIEPKRSRVKKWFRRHPAASSAGSVGMVLGICLVPLLWGTLAWVAQSRNISAAAAFEAFAGDSERILAVLLSDRRRDEAEFVDRGYQTLQRHGILQRQDFQKLIAADLSNVERQRIEQTAQRHVVIVAMLELEQLLRRKSIDGADAVDTDRIDRLIEVADRLDGDLPSRSSNFLQSARSKIVGEPDQAIRLADAAKKIDPANDGERFLEAIRLLIQKDFQGSSKDLTELADRNSVPSGLRWIALGYSQYNDERYDEAALSFTQSIVRYPELASLRVIHGQTLMQLHQGAKADAELTKAIDLDPSNSRAWMLRATLRSGRQEFDKAIADYTRVLSLVPGHIPALLGRSNAYRVTGQLTNAVNDMDRAMESDDVSSPSLYARARVRRETDPLGALADFQMADKLDPNNPSILNAIGRLLSDRLDRNQEGIAYLHRIIEIQPNDERALIDYAVLLGRAGRHDEARQFVDRALSISRNNRTLYQAACVCALNPNRPSQIDAVTFLARAIREGYVPTELQADPDLASLKGMPGFAAILRTQQLAEISDRKNP